MEIFKITTSVSKLEKNIYFLDAFTASGKSRKSKNLKVKQSQKMLSDSTELLYLRVYNNMRHLQEHCHTSEQLQSSHGFPYQSCCKTPQC